MNRKNFAIARGFIASPQVLVGLLLLVVLALFFYNNLFASRTSQTINLLQSSSLEQSATPTATTRRAEEGQLNLLNTTDWLTYTSTKDHFSIKYPPSWSVREVPNDPFVYFSPPRPANWYELKQVAAQITVRSSRREAAFR